MTDGKILGHRLDRTLYTHSELFSIAETALARGRKQNDRADLDDMGKDIALPEVTQHAIMNYPLPDHQPGEKYSPFTYLHTDSARNLCGTVHNVASPEMLYCSSSSGEHFDRRARELRQSPSVVEGIIRHARQPATAH